MEEQKMEVKTANGRLVVHEDPYYSGIWVEYFPDGMDTSIEVATIEDIPKALETPVSKAGNLSVLVWGDPYQEDYSWRTDISVKDIKDAMNSLENEVAVS